MDANLSKIEAIGIVPVIKIDQIEDAYPLAKALCEGGLPVAEITFRTEYAKEAMAIITEKCPQMLVGAGTVLTTQQVDDAIEAGAKFIVSPGLNPKIVQYCQSKGICIIPGCANASDIEIALSLGLEIVKFFPAEALGGIKMIKALAAPYVNMRFMPTGGVNADNINQYLSYDKIVACGGTWMVDAAKIKAKDFEGIKNLTKQAVATMLNLKLAHVGINAQASESMDIAQAFSNLLEVSTKEGNSSIFAGDSIEVMKEPYLGANGHLAYSTNSLLRAIRYYESMGYKFNQESAKYNANNKMIAIYFQESIGGFAIHLVEKQ